ncbi:MAG: DUF2390 domain-containing protein, partial [Stellaceae bacterium]
LTQAALDAADRAVAPWREKVVERLRETRRAVKAAALPGSEGLYAKAKAAELEAERMLQSSLAGLAAAPTRRPTPERFADALANLSLYLGAAPAEPLHAALQRLAAADFTSGAG